MSALERLLRRERDRLDRAVVDALDEVSEELVRHRRKDEHQDARLTALEERMAVVERGGGRAVPAYVVRDVRRIAAELKALADSIVIPGPS